MVDNQNPNDGTTRTKAGAEKRSKLGLPEVMKLGAGTPQIQLGGMKNPPTSFIPMQDVSPDPRHGNCDESSAEVAESETSHPALATSRRDSSSR